MEAAIAKILLDDLEPRKKLILNRFLMIYRKNKIRAHMYRIVHMVLGTLNLVFTIMGMSLLLGLEYDVFSGWVRITIFWVVWITMLLSMVITRISSMLELKKRMIMCQLNVDHLKSEGWLFLSGVPPYNTGNIYESLAERMPEPHRQTRSDSEAMPWPI